MEVVNPSANLIVQTSGPIFAGGVDGSWHTDLEAVPRINRAARDWHRSFFAALSDYGLDATAAFSMELGNGDPTVEAGIAQQYPSQAPVLLNTPALQTNFSPNSAHFWQQVYTDMANVLVAANVRFGPIANTSNLLFERCSVSFDSRHGY